jgi:hypothetical protein
VWQRQDLSRLQAPTEIYDTTPPICKLFPEYPPLIRCI